MTDTDVPRCWSFSPNGERCEQRAGHTDQHSVSVVWSDADAWTPQLVATAGSPTTGQVPVYAVPDLPDVAPLSSGSCLNCDHPTHGEPCEVRVGRAECGCTFKAV